MSSHRRERRSPPLPPRPTGLGDLPVDVLERITARLSLHNQAAMEMTGRAGRNAVAGRDGGLTKRRAAAHALLAKRLLERAKAKLRDEVHAKMMYALWFGAYQRHPDDDDGLVYMDDMFAQLGRVMRRHPHISPAAEMYPSSMPWNLTGFVFPAGGFREVREGLHGYRAIGVMFVDPETRKALTTKKLLFRDGKPVAFADITSGRGINPAARRLASRAVSDILEKEYGIARRA